MIPAETDDKHVCPLQEDRRLVSLIPEIRDFKGQIMGRSCDL